ncbi:MAG: tRNA (adenosine(37)-N6)-dimethylallyltransferase MiaA [Chloroflexi bacterium]|nr:tRNA (adenosine(37)-N6)-dimethylallyltransferase MiaA [Chloroflexota bacterium]
MAGPRVLFIVGPTASGKTAASLELASHARIEVVNADSRQVYRSMSVGTGKPVPAELASVPHHLIDVAAPDERYNLARFLAEARAAIADIASRDAVPVVVGGTGQYVWGLVEGWHAPAVPPNPQLRAELAEEARMHGSGALHERLRAVDPRAADATDPRNVRRVVRALEVWHETGAPFSRQRRKSPPEFEPVLLGIAPERAALRQRAAERVDAMLDGGWPEEVRHLLNAGYGPELPSFSSVGYREVAAYVQGNMTLDATAEQVKSATHRLIRQQTTWFKATDERIAWNPDSGALAARASRLTERARS